MSTAPTTGLVFHPGCLEHDPGPGHPERPARLRAVLDRVHACSLAGELALHQPEPVARDTLLAAHDERYVQLVEAACRRGGGLLDGGDTVASVGSYAAALLAAGGLVEAVDRVLDAAWRNAFVAVRPPGHHAEHAQALGFCLFNNVAVAALHLRRARGLERVAILDWDVHHGNGTQHAFERDASVFYASLHQYPHFPGTGAAAERGLGPGEGSVLNCPLAAGTGDAEWLAAFDDRVLPALRDFAPDFLLVSAGFDAHRDDPLSGTRVTDDAFRRMTRGALDLAREVCHGRLVAVLEGGYDLQALAGSVETCLGELVQG